MAESTAAGSVWSTGANARIFPARYQYEEQVRDDGADVLPVVVGEYSATSESLVSHGSVSWPAAALASGRARGRRTCSHLPRQGEWCMWDQAHCPACPTR